MRQSALHCNYSESRSSRGQHGVWVLCMVGRCHAVPIPATSQIGTSLPPATWQRCSVALKPVMPGSLVTARAFNWHISLVTAHLYCLLSSTEWHSLSSSSGCLTFWPWNARRLLLVSLSRILFFAPVYFRSHHTFSRYMVSNVFYFNYPKLYFCREWTIKRSCSHNLLNTWFALLFLMHDGLICLEAEQYQAYFK